MKSALIFVSIFSFLSLSQADDSPIRLVSGGPAALELLRPLEADIEKAAGAGLEMSVNPNELAMLALTKGLVDMVVGPKLDAALAAAEKRGAAKQDAADYEAHPLSLNTVKIGVHPDNPAKALTREQITDILSGKLKNWKSINGKDLPLTAYVAKNYLTATKSVGQFYLKSETIPGATQVLDKDGLLRMIQKDPGALGFFTTKDKMADFEPKFFMTEASRTNFLIIKKKGRPEARKAFEFIKSKGLFKD